MHAFQLHVITGVKIFPDDARQKTASLLDQEKKELIAPLMNYDPATGKSITGFPPVHFAHNNNGFTMVGYGNAGHELVSSLAGRIALAWSSDLDKPVMVEGKQIPCDLQAEQYMVSYRVPRMVLQKRPEHIATLSDAVAGKRFIEALFLRSIERQAQYLGITMPKDVRVEFVGCSGEFSARNGKGSPACLGIRGAIFKVNLRLKGLWSVGRLMSKGYGLINADLQRGGEFLEVSHALPQ